MTKSESRIAIKLPLSVRSRIVESLASLREEWEKAAGDKGLVKVHASTGLLLFDVVERLGLAPEDVRTLLGGQLCKELAELISEQSVE